MTDSDTRTSAQYKKVRDAFAELDTQDKTAFVLEATFSTIGTALNETGQRVAEVFEKVSSEDFWSDFGMHADASETAPPKAKTTRKKSGPKKSTTKKRTPKKDDDA
ncbi:MAG: hypothetical protein HKN04_06210 [Rhodothermaceae bacterium]|nr:hypothetical protein [Rhodothermaceae bacterium]